MSPQAVGGAERAATQGSTQSPIIDQGLELLSEDEAVRLLAGGVVGRIGITIGALPAIFPVNYRLIDGVIIFRTAPGSKMSAAAGGSVVAFEVDDWQLDDRSGWSVLAVGRATVVDDGALADQALAAHLEPFVDGARNVLVRIEPTFVSGRRLVHGLEPLMWIDRTAADHKARRDVACARPRQFQLSRALRRDIPYAPTIDASRQDVGMPANQSSYAGSARPARRPVMVMGSTANHRSRRPDAHGRTLSRWRRWPPTSAASVISLAIPVTSTYQPERDAAL